MHAYSSTNIFSSFFTQYNNVLAVFLPPLLDRQSLSLHELGLEFNSQSNRILTVPYSPVLVDASQRGNIVQETGSMDEACIVQSVEVKSITVIIGEASRPASS